VYGKDDTGVKFPHNKASITTQWTLFCHSITTRRNVCSFFDMNDEWCCCCCYGFRFKKDLTVFLGDPFPGILNVDDVSKQKIESYRIISKAAIVWEKSPSM
jgi:hypothetical protein